MRASDVDLLVASDFDGTLAPIVHDPEQAALPAAAAATLTALSQTPRVQVAILSGRTLEELYWRCAPLGALWLSAEHGHTVISPARRITTLAPRPSAAARDLLAARANEIAGVFRGARAEHKACGVALHYRDVDEAKHEALIDMFRLACSMTRAELLHGRRVVEGRLSRASKGDALAFILDQIASNTAVLYAGDDRTDESALRAARARPLGLSLHVSSSERPAPPFEVDAVLDGPGAWAEQLAAIAAVLADRDARPGIAARSRRDASGR